MVNEEREMINEVPGSSPEFRTELAEQLADLAPEAIADGKIDVEKLKELLEGDASDTSERFGLFWPGKKRAMRAAQTPTTATLRPDKENSKDWDTTKNVFIEGDNLEVLKILQKHYHGKIKMIYIDPPYNTGKDFVYQDDFKEGINTYLEWSKQVNEEGKKMSSNSESEGRYHSNWLNMMYPRLKLARNLLEANGVIFISIGVDEMDNLKKICNEVFGEQNHIATFVWEKTQHFGRQKVNTYSNYDYVLCFARQLYSRDGMKKELLVEYEKNEFEDAPLYNASNPTKVVKFPAGTVKFNIKDGEYSRSTDEKYCLLSEVRVVDGRNLNDFELEFRSRWSAQKVIDEVSMGTTYWVKTQAFAIRAIYGAGKTFKESPRELIFTNGGAVNATKSRFGQKVGTSDEGTAEVSSLMKKKVFDYPKPTSLIQYLVSLVEPGIILDFFAGSGTTAESVMRVNSSDQHRRRFILVQLPEPVPSGSIAESEGYKTIAEVSRERVRRAAEQISKVTKNEAPTCSSRLDTGFRSYMLADTNFTKWRTESDIDATKLEQHLLELRDSSDDNATADDLLTEILIKQGHSLVEQIRELSIADLKYKSVVRLDEEKDEEDTFVLAYLDEHTKPSLSQLRAAVDTKPVQFIILEDAFQGDDELKTNLAQMCKTNNIELWTA
ncbi:site-specific DNA-methyltransferase [Corynebacterium sp. H128]|uniref:site-specific DNA-methyltransferase n=1 Tax=unclassified Corynebacterium TaxID=2624378 RepID=UPI0030963008